MFQFASKFARALDHPNIIHRHLELRWCPDPDEPKVFTRFLRPSRGDILDAGVCHMAFFADPDGNALMLHHRYAPRVTEG
jgi:hypothetical protein